WLCVINFTALSVTVIGITIFIRHELFAWIIFIVFLSKTEKFVPFSHDYNTLYKEHAFYLYGAIRVLNCSIYFSRNPKIKLNKELLLRIIQYLFYPAYSSILIVLFEDFDAQMRDVEHGNNPKTDSYYHYNSKQLLNCYYLEIFNFIGILKLNSWTFRTVAVKILRLVLCYYSFELILHLIHVNSFFEADPQIFDSLSFYEVVSVAYLRGQLFHMKYVVIFGIPAAFASLDGLKPPDPPICISRVSRYSRMWRNFDRGLYQFLKNQIYLPIGRAITLPYCQRLTATVATFLFVLAWHGVNSVYVCWVLFSGAELCIESIGKAINKTKLWWKISDRIGAINQRRIIAIAMNFTVTPGVLGVFFFLGGYGTGTKILKRTMLQGIYDCLHLNFTTEPYCFFFEKMQILTTSFHSFPKPLHNST
ncbi:unnamed protein product, partial [Enterobius vermicularis]|uniref:MBOAT family protein n=1 Tax=Enterobius vermicularis TaxID=51028 RepID=A0A0N4UVM0_ENTVE